MSKYRRKRSLDRIVQTRRSTNILFVGIEGGSRTSSKEAKYLDMFHGFNKNVQVRVYPCDEHKSAPLHVLDHLKNKLKEEILQEGDEAWLVIDRDRYGSHLPEVARRCNDANVRLALSNPCFEYWLLLHLVDPQAHLQSCGDVKPVLSAALDRIDTSEGFESIYIDRFQTAVDRAERRDTASDRWPQQNGSRVYQLVKRIVRS